MNKRFLSLFLCGVASVLQAATPAFTDFDLTQFATNGNKLRAKDGAMLTNMNLLGRVTFTNNGSGATPPKLQGRISDLYLDQGNFYVGPTNQANYISLRPSSSVPILEGKGSSGFNIYYNSQAKITLENNDTIPLDIGGTISTFYNPGTFGLQAYSYTGTTTVTPDRSRSIYLIATTTTNTTVNLPTAVGINGRQYTFKKTDTNTFSVFLNGNAAETIDGALTNTLSAYNQSVTITSDGANWSTLASMAGTGTNGLATFGARDTHVTWGGAGTGPSLGVASSAFGAYALTSDNGTYNTAIGAFALYGSTLVSKTTAVGENAGGGLLQGDNNVFVGRLAGGYAVDETEFVLGGNTLRGDNNVLVGAGIVMPPGGFMTNNILIGHQAGIGFTNIIKDVVVIGAHSMTNTSVDQTNIIVLGANINGVTNSNTGQIGNGVNIGINTNNAQARLHVNGTSFFDGNVGIGTNNPVAPLVIRGDTPITIWDNSDTAGYSNFRFYEANVLKASILQYGSTGGDVDRRNDFEFIANSGDISFSADGGTTYGLILKAGSNVGISTNTPQTRLHVSAADDATAQTIQIEATQANITAADTFLDFRSATGSEGSVAGTGVAGIIAYNTFSASHWTEVIGTNTPPVGYLLEMLPGLPVWAGRTNIFTNMVATVTTNADLTFSTNFVSVTVTNLYRPSPKAQLFRSRVCQTLGSKAAVGVYAGTDKEGRDLCLSMGIGVMWISNKGADLAIGDYVIASNVRGHAEKQSDDIRRSSTVAKLTENITWVGGQTNRLANVLFCSH